jgi:amidase
MEGEDAHDPATARCASPPGHDYRPFLKPDGLRGARIGIPRAVFYESVRAPGSSTHVFGGLNAAQQAVAEQAIQVLKDQGAIVVDPADVPSLMDARPEHNFLAFPSCDAARQAHCTIVWLYGMKRDFNAWLATLGTSAPVHSLTDLRAFNVVNAARGAIKYGQDELDAADAIDLIADRPRYEADRARDVDLAATHGIDEVMAAHHLDALLTWMNTIGSLAGRAGYPSITVPFGWVDNTPNPPFPPGFDAKAGPFGATFTSTACQEPRLIEIAYAFEQATKKRSAPSSTP